MQIFRIRSSIYAHWKLQKISRRRIVWQIVILAGESQENYVHLKLMLLNRGKEFPKELFANIPVFASNAIVINEAEGKETGRMIHSLWMAFMLTNATHHRYILWK